MSGQSQEVQTAETNSQHEQTHPSVEFAYPALKCYPEAGEGRQRVSELPEPGADRIMGVDFGALISRLDGRLTRYTATVDDDPDHHIDVCGVVVGGSFVAGGFEPEQSDFDIAPVFSEQYHDFEGYARSIRAEGKRWNDAVFPRLQHDTVQKIDPIEAATVDTVCSVATPPCVVVF